MIVVADASPLNFLVRLKRSESLPILYGRVSICPGVAAELSHPNTPRNVRDWVAKVPSWVDLVQVPRLDASLPETLGRGEREAISLAVQHTPSLLLVDDLRARRLAARRHLRVAGTLTVLSDIALAQGLDYQTLLQELRGLGHRVSSSLLAHAMRIHKAEEVERSRIS